MIVSYLATDGGENLKIFSSIVVPPEDLALFKNIEKIIEAMPEVDLGKDEKGEKVLVSCHMICRALSRFFPVKYKDGYFGDFNKHSWLVTQSGLIIDPYPVAVVGGPILIEMRYVTPWRKLYREASFPELSNPNFRKNVDKIFEALRQTIKNLNM